MYNVEFKSAGTFSAGELQLIEVNLQRAGAIWDSVLARALPFNVTIEVTSEAGYADATSEPTWGSYRGSSNELSASYALRTGQLDTSLDHIQIRINESEMRNSAFFDPTPWTDGDTPSDKVDFTYVMLHEVGHALGFNGYTDWQSYTVGEYTTPFDMLISVSGGVPYFVGENAIAYLGRPVPLTVGNVFHIGNEAPLPGSELPEDILNPYVPWGAEGLPSDLDLAILADLGIGTRRSDILRGQTNDDNIAGGLGHDLITGAQGNDIIFGNQDNDEIYGNEGVDRLFGGQGDDYAFGGKDADYIEGNFGSDQIFGNFGDDYLHGGRDDDYIHGGQGNDTIVGGAGDDTLAGGLGNDVFVFGYGQGSDVVQDYSAGDRLDTQGQNYALSDANGAAIVALAGGGVVTLLGISTASLEFSLVA